MTASTTPNSKGDLIARLISLGLNVPTFDVEVSGPPHERTFQATVSVGGRILGTGEGRSKKEAERLASEEALLALEAPDGEAPQAAPQPSGTWPIYAPVLAQAVEAALEFAPDDATLDDVQRDAARFYRGLLLELGYGPEEQE